MTVQVDLTDPAVTADPLPAYARLRAEAPVYWSPELKGWVVTRYRDVRDVIRDPRFSVEKLAPFAAQRRGSHDAETLAAILGDWMVFRDPPRHGELRRALKNAFMPRDIARLEPAVQAVVDELIDAIEGREACDLLREFAFPLPAIVISDLFGLPRTYAHQLKDWSQALGDFVLASAAERGRHARPAAAARAMQDCFRDLVAEHRARPRDDFTSLLLRDGAGLSEDEIIHTLVLVLWAGHETTTNLIANGTLHLLRNPDAWARLVRDPSLAAAAVEEFLRFDGPAQMLARIAKADLTVGGQAIAAGDKVYAHLTAANHDPEVFDDADTLEIERRKNRHLGFGHGIHACLGAPLARLEGTLAFSALARRLPDMELAADTIDWSDIMIVRAMRGLPVRFSGRRES